MARNRPDLLPDCWRNKASGTTDVFGTDVVGRALADHPDGILQAGEGLLSFTRRRDRPITHREAARLQTFPDDFVFEGTKIEVARQIGNAVPPRLAEAVARAVQDTPARSLTRDAGPAFMLGILGL